jgi:hypothetical protein
MKKHEIQSYHLEVDPSFYGRDLEQLHNLCKDIETQIRRHVDGHGTITIVPEYKDTCNHCGSQWTEDSEFYNGGCCDKDILENDIKCSRCSKCEIVCDIKVFQIKNDKSEYTATLCTECYHRLNKTHFISLFRDVT